MVWLEDQQLVQLDSSALVEPRREVSPTRICLESATAIVALAEATGLGLTGSIRRCTVGGPDHERTLLVGSTPLSPLPDGRRLRTLAAADITDQKHAQESLLEADRQKDTFLAMLGHELRNPLAAIRSTAQLLEQLPLGEGPLLRARGVLLRQSAHMAQLVDGLLDVSRIARGKLTVVRQVVDLGAILAATADDRGPEVRACGLEPADAPPVP